MIEIENFNSGEYRQGYDYKYFIPRLVNEEWIWSDPSINKLLERASFELGQLNSYAQLVPNMDLFIHLHITKEAVVSSKIEGTRTHLDEALQQKKNISAERRDDWQEVQNYTEAMNAAIAELEMLPISSRLILKTHEKLMQGVRGDKKTPGQYRTSQNWIGGKSLSDAVFIPPHHNHLDELMSDLENFIHNESLNIPLLIKVAIVHYQFETIHPFLDGNGRMGRLLITLFLIEKKVLLKPLLYLSTFFENDKELYYGNLTKVRTRNDMLQWVKYFLVGMQHTSSQASKTLSEILKLRDQNDQIIHLNFGRRITAGIELHKVLFKTPIVAIKDVQSITKLSFKAAADLVNAFVSNNILKEYTGNNRNKVYIYEKYLELFE